jgi:hypothetical protein
MCKDRLSSGLSDEIVEKLPHKIGVEIRGLSIFHCFRSEAHGTIRNGRNLLNPTIAVVIDLGVNRRVSVVFAV